MKSANCGNESICGTGRLVGARSPAGFADGVIAFERDGAAEFVSFESKPVAGTGQPRPLAR